MFILIFFAFLAGVSTIAAPCILPILPVVLSAGISGGKQRPLGIVTGLIASFTFFTLSLSYLARQFGISPDILRTSAIVVLLLFGLLMVVPQLFTQFEVFVGRIIPQKTTRSNRTDFWGGMLVGLSLGLVWTPCVGPIIASVITLAATSSVTLGSIFITLAYAFGTGVPLIILIYGGQGLMRRVKVLSKNSGTIQRIFGIIMVLTALGMTFGIDRTLQAELLAKIPSSFSAGLTQQIEQSNTVQDQLKQLKGTSGLDTSHNTQILGGASSGLPVLGKAPEFTGISHWLNSDPLTLESLKGKVVLVDFWTYSCINCIRTLPHVTSWYDSYKDQGFVVIGVHAPEFAFEKETNNVADAIKQFGIHYPVAQDNDLATWSAYNNQYWPAEYLIDAQGNVRETNFGEGEYDTTEKNIRALLQEAKGMTTVLPTAPSAADLTPTGQISPETYLGTDRRLGFEDSASTLGGNQWTLSGGWDIGSQYITTTDTQASLSYSFTAKDVYLVLNPSTSGVGTVEVQLDGKTVNGVGTDAVNGVITVDTDRLYHLVHLDGDESHVLTLRFKSTGIKAFAFTFG